MCIVCFHFWISNLFLFVRKVEVTTHKNGSLGTALVSLFLHHIPQNTVVRYLSPRKNKVMLDQRTRSYYLTEPDSQLRFTPWKFTSWGKKHRRRFQIIFPWPYEAKCSQDFTGIRTYIFLFFFQFTWSATTTITTPEHVLGIRRSGMATFYVIRWMTYCEGAIFSLTHSFTHSVVSRSVTAG